MIVTIDGPAGAGKSSASRGLAQRLGFMFLDTGAMYRAVAFAAREQGVDPQNDAALAELARCVRLDMSDDRVLLNDQDVTRAIRTMEITNLTRHTASNAAVREYLVEQQRAIAADKDVVTEGRDQGTVAFPEAECKIFLTATPAERARRRMADLAQRGEAFDFAEVLARQEERDERDRTRSVGPLVQAADAIEIFTDGLTTEQVIDQLEALVKAARQSS